MPFLEPPTPFAIPPRTAPPDGANLPVWEGGLDLDHGYARIRGHRIESDLDLAGCQELELVECAVSNVSFAGAPGIELDLDRCAMSNCDLSGRVRGRGLRRSTLTGCRLTGLDLSESVVEDLLVAGGIMRYGNFRMAECTRIAFADLALDDVDFQGATMAHVSFNGCELNKVVFDRCRMSTIDLRGATRLDISAASGLEGVLISDEQVFALAYLFAHASGVSIVRSSEPEE